MNVILFDFFGVLCDPPLSQAIKALVDEPEEQKRLIGRLTELDLGDISEADLIADIAQVCGRSDEEVFNISETYMKLDLGMVSLARSLKETHTVGLLSNAARNIIERGLGEHINLFDGVYISSDLKMIKPNADIFERVLDDLGVMAKDVLFIDDRKENTDAAEKLGIRGHVFTDQQSLERELSGQTSVD